MIIDTILRLSSRSKHSAFTDLISCGTELLCCYRQATNHISGDGNIEIVRMAKSGEIKQREKIAITNVDLRDPKLSIDANGRYWLIAFARYHAIDGDHKQTRMLSWFSDNGLSWSSVHEFGDNHWWLWRIAWKHNRAFGLAYNRPQNRLDLCIGHPHSQMYRQAIPAMSLDRDGLGYPNESALLISENATITALVRRDADTFTAQLGTSKPPYRKWHWRDLGDYIGGPDMIKLTDNTALVCGRKWTGKRFVTQLWTLHLPSAKLTPQLTLPSAGDNSYPGLVIDGDTLYVSYYSSHIDNETRVYLARISGLNELRNIVEE